MHIYNKENPHFPSKNKIETSRTVIYYIIPIGTEITGTDITGTDITGTYITGTDFTGTDITGMDITDNFSYFVNIFTQIKGRKLV